MFQVAREFDEKVHRRRAEWEATFPPPVRRTGNSEVAEQETFRYERDSPRKLAGHSVPPSAAL